MVFFDLQRDERLGWMGDADLSAESMLINYDCGAFFQMFMKNMDSEIDPDGSLTDVVPFVRYGSRPGDPSWTAAFIEVAYQLFKQDGKAGIPKMYWDKIQLHLSKFAEMAKADASKWPPTEYGKRARPWPSRYRRDMLWCSVGLRYYRLYVCQVAVLISVGVWSQTCTLL